ncbi:putative fatty acyl-CoA reductase CG5065 [Melitaea cinxia]|uniref:putative fatty acyl-CoA reductase CG5065 n=1 Tax=Melitaea cinxia TaxID=113334 RepID=UPI001E27254D|nr:putative fatty acyl-CoA reductase CG5065 [Melitaea cinxia]
MYCKSSIQIDAVPVDYTINGLILLAYMTGLEKPKDIRVCNLTLSGSKTMTWTDCSKFWGKYVKQYPLSYCLWYPVAKEKNFKIEQQIDAFFTHVLPAYFIDLILLLLGQKTFMINVLNRLTYGLEVLEYYTTRKWDFKNDYFRYLGNKIPKEEKEVFYTDLSLVDIDDFMKNYIKGIREFYCKEDASTLPKAKKLLRRMYYLHLFTVYSVYAMCLYIIYCIYIKVFS